MKKNVIQYITLLLVAILLPLTMIQGIRLEQYRSQLSTEFNSLENQLYNTMDDIRYDLIIELERSSQPVENYDISLEDLDLGSHRLQLDVSVTLKKWSEDSTVTLIVENAGIRSIQDMTTDGTGTYTAVLDVTLDQVRDLWMEAMVTTSGVSTKLELGGYGDITYLLPLISSGCSWSEPEYHRGTLQMDYEVYLQWQYQPGTVSNASFDIYVSDELVQTIPASAQPDLIFALSHLDIPCGENDTVRLDFRCEDSFGVGYILPCLEIVLEEGNVAETISMDMPEYYWITDAENCDH